MAIATSVELEGGRPVVRHRSDAAGVTELRAHAARLAAAAGPGVVEVLRSGPDGDGWEVVTAFAGPPLSATAAGSAPRLAAVGAEVAGVLARLHDHGVVHGRLTPGRVLAGTGDGPVLCGFGASDGGRTTADDVAALGTVLAGLAAAAPEDGATAALLALADRARADEPAARPSARSLAHDLRALAGRGPAHRRPRPSRRMAVGALGVAGTALALAVALAPDGDRPDRRDRPAVESGAEGPSPSSAPATTARPVPPCVARDGEPLLAHDCGRRVEVEGPVVWVDGERSVVGRPGDEVLVADWSCTGQLRPALLRPATGEVLVLSPPAPDGVRAVEAAARIRGATRLAVTADVDGCPTLLARRSDGEEVPVPSGSAGGDHE